MIKISACVIARDEAGNIARCLQSVKGAVDEMIVVDTGSVDDTVAIAAAAGAKVYYHQWEDDFSAARNYALAQAKGDWIVFLDADEYIAPDKAPNLRPILSRLHGDRRIEAVSCAMEHTEGFDGTLRARDRTVRIFRNSPAIRYQGRIHEFIRKNGRFTRALHLGEYELVIRHTGYAREKQPEKLVRNHALLEQSLADGSVDGLTYYYLAHSYWTLGKYEKAVEYASKAIEDGMVASSMFAHRVYCVLIDSLLQQDGCRLAEVEPLVAEAAGKFPRHPEVLKCRGLFLRRSGFFGQARDALLAALAANEGYDDDRLANEFPFSVAQVHAAVADLYGLMNDMVKAFEHYVAALKLQKDEAVAFDGLVSLVRPQKAADIAALINSLYDLGAEADVGFIVTRLAALREGKVFPYYEKLWAERFGHREFTATKFLLSGHYAQAEQLFIAAFRETGDLGAELLAAVAFLFGGRPPRAELPKRLPDPALRRIAAAFFWPEEGTAQAPEDFPLFLELLKNALHIGGEDELGRLLAVTRLFPPGDAASRVADLLAERGLYRQALKAYEYQLGQAGGLARGELYCRAGFCCYKLRDYDAAEGFFALALANGFDDRVICEYLAWAHRQCRDGAVKGRLSVLQARYGLEA